jgi:hypothetical protein
MDPVVLIRVVAGFFCLFALVIAILYLVTLSSALAKCSANTRTMDPGLVWLLLIPIFNLMWHFFVVQAVAKSLAAEFRSRSIYSDEPNPGKSGGVAMCVCGVCVLIPLLNILIMVPYLVLWVMYWNRIAGYSRLLDRRPSVDGMPQSTQAA